MTDSHNGWFTHLPWTPRQTQNRKIPAQVDAGEGTSVAIGGIGAGAITRGVNGGFLRWSLKAGAMHCGEWPENGFALWHADHGARALRMAGPDAPDGWHFDPQGTHAALFPKLRHEYVSGDLTLSIEQIAPIAPEISEDCDLPVGLFRASLSNRGTEPTEAAVMFSFLNLVGWFHSFGSPGHAAGVAGQRNRIFKRPDLCGVEMFRETIGEPDEGEGQMFIGAARKQGWSVTFCDAFDPAREGAAFWKQFVADGSVGPIDGDWQSGGGFSEFPPPRHCAAVSAKTMLLPGETRTTDLVLTWDMPVVRFGQNRKHFRHYTERWGRDGRNAAAIAEHALAQADHWISAIDRFHATAAADIDAAPAISSLAINELYPLNDALTVWTARNGDEPAHFGIIECPDYPLYNTLDLWVYASAGISRFFPDLAASVTRDFAREIITEDTTPRFHLRSRQRFARQRMGMAPHDLGAPNADPFFSANDYVYQDSARWKDLNAMLVICAWRDVLRNPNRAAAHVDAINTAMTALAAFDRDGDGVIENDGFPDQTFDNIPMQGISAYCGGLWLAALRAATQINLRTGNRTQAQRWRDLSAKGEPSWHEALWNGTCYSVDNAGQFRDAVFAEQLYGPGLARMLKLGDICPPEHARRALKEVYRRNFEEAGHGRGVMAMTSAIHDSSLYAPRGEEGLQWDEILVGFNYSIAATMRTYGLTGEAQTILTALAEELGPQRGLHFRTPAAYTVQAPLIRAQMNMRPMGIWAYADAKGCGV